MADPKKPTVVVIGAGATGCGVARDLALRGCAVTLVERDLPGMGSSARFHGLLQSGARYAVSDPHYAAECMQERQIIARIASQAVDLVGGVFVTLPDEPADYMQRFVLGCEEAHIPCKELDPARVMDEQPAISRQVQHAFAVPDATLNPWRLINLLCDDIRRHQGHIVIHHKVKQLRTDPGGSWRIQIDGNGGEQTLKADAVVNAAGPWSNQVANLAGAEVSMELTKGVIMVFNNRMVTRVINRCRAPGDHDILAPVGAVSLLGATSEIVDDPGTTEVNCADVQALLDGGERLIPGIRHQADPVTWAGVRPLIRPPDWPADEPTPRRHQVIDHSISGLPGLFTVSGGSLSTHRSMAEDVCNHVCAWLGAEWPCQTATTTLGETDAPSWPRLTA